MIVRVGGRVGRAGFVQIGCVNGLLEGQQVGGGDQGQIVGRGLEGTGQLALVEMLEQGLENLDFPGEALDRKSVV